MKKQAFFSFIGIFLIQIIGLFKIQFKDRRNEIDIQRLIQLKNNFYDQLYDFQLKITFDDKIKDTDLLFLMIDQVFTSQGKEIDLKLSLKEDIICKNNCLKLKIEIDKNIKQNILYINDLYDFILVIQDEKNVKTQDFKDIKQIMMRLNLKLLDNFSLIKDNLAQSMIIFDVFIVDYGNLKRFGNKQMTDLSLQIQQIFQFDQSQDINDFLWQNQDIYINSVNQIDSIKQLLSNKIQSKLKQDQNYTIEQQLTEVLENYGVMNLKNVKHKIVEFISEIKQLLGFSKEQLRINFQQIDLNQKINQKELNAYNIQNYLNNDKFANKNEFYIKYCKQISLVLILSDEKFKDLSGNEFAYASLDKQFFFLQHDAIQNFDDFKYKILLEAMNLNVISEAIDLTQSIQVEYNIQLIQQIFTLKEKKILIKKIINQIEFFVTQFKDLDFSFDQGLDNVIIKKQDIILINDFIKKQNNLKNIYLIYKFILYLSKYNIFIQINDYIQKIQQLNNDLSYLQIHQMAWSLDDLSQLDNISVLNTFDQSYLFGIYFPLIAIPIISIFNYTLKILYQKLCTKFQYYQ